MIEKHYDTVVVGGGLAGLTAAAYLARAGKTVVVLEKAKQLGGRAQTQLRGDFLFNLGPHALYEGGPATQILDEMNIPWHGGEPEVAGTVVYQKQGYPLSFRPQDILRSKLFSIRERISFIGLLAKLMRTDPGNVAELPVGDWIAQETDSPVLRHTLHALVRLSTYTNAPDLLSTAVFLSQVQLQGGVRYLDGGWQTLVAGLRREAEARGAKILTGIRVTAVADEPRQATIHLADGQLIVATAVILAVDPQTAADLVPTNSMLQHWAETTVPARAAVLDVALRRLPNPNGNFALGADEPTYLSNHAVYARLGPENQPLIHVAKYLPPTPTEAEQDEAELEALLDRVQPGWRQELVERRFLPNMTVISRLALAAEGGLNGRPGYAVPNSHTLYLAGDWIGPEGWLANASFASGKRAAELVVAQSVEIGKPGGKQAPIAHRQL